jgi:hypothetical protein
MSYWTLYFRNWESTVWKRPFSHLQNPIDMKAFSGMRYVGVPMPSPKIVDALLALETQKVPSLPVAALILGAVSQVETLIEVVDRVCDPVFRHPIKTTTDCARCPLP